MQIPSAKGAYRVEHVTRSPLAALPEATSRIFLVDETVLRLHGRGALRSLARERVVVVRANEQLKTLAGVGRMAATVLDMRLTRKTRLVAIGGGTVQDAAGFLASIAHRGLEWDFVPTTVLAQADSCIGGKTSINHGPAKNVLGTFHPPRTVQLWTGFARTLTDHDFLSGVGEIAKLHLLGSAATRRLWQQSRARVLARRPAASDQLTWSSLVIKRRYLIEDEFDTGIRQFLNFGHCFGHAIEAATHFGVPHGQAVVMGIELANHLSVARGLMREATRQRVHQEYLLDIRLARFRPTPRSTTALVAAMGRDKKREGQGLAVIVLDDRLRPSKLLDVSEDEVRAALARWSGEQPRT